MFPYTTFGQLLCDRYPNECQDCDRITYDIEETRNRKKIKITTHLFSDGTRLYTIVLEGKAKNLKKLGLTSKKLFKTIKYIRYEYVTYHIEKAHI